MTLPVSLKAASSRTSLPSNDSLKSDQTPTGTSGPHRKFSRGDATPVAGARNGFVRREVDGGFRGRYERVTNESSEQQALNQQYLNNAISGMTAATNGISYTRFKHNGQDAIFQRTIETGNYYLAFQNSHESRSLLNRIFRTPVSFQFIVNPRTNQIKQIQGPERLTNAQMAAVLEALTISFLARPQ